MISMVKTSSRQEELFQASLKFILDAEGGLSDRPLSDDPGGLTNFGITQSRLIVYRRQFPGESDVPSSVQSLTSKLAERIYRRMFWDPCYCAELPPSVAIVVFNAAVQSGPSRASKWLQDAINTVGSAAVRVDSIIGPKTIASVHASDIESLVEETLTNQLMFEDYLNNWSVNRRGWTKRLFKICWNASLFSKED